MAKRLTRDGLQVSCPTLTWCQPITSLGRARELQSVGCTGTGTCEDSGIPGVKILGAPVEKTPMKMRSHLLGITWFPLESGRRGKGPVWVFDRNAMEKKATGPAMGQAPPKMPLCHLRGLCELWTSKEFSSCKAGTTFSQTKLYLCYRWLPHKQLLHVDVLFDWSVQLHFFFLQLCVI